MIRTYDPLAGNLNLNGFTITGFADGTHLSIERDEPLFTTQVGNGGEVTRSKNVGGTATVKLSLAQTSTDNKILSAMYQADQLANKGIGVFYFSDGDDKVTGAECWVDELPAMSRATEAGPVEWTLKIAKAEFFFGGIRA